MVIADSLQHIEFSLSMASAISAKIRTRKDFPELTPLRLSGSTLGRRRSWGGNELGWPSHSALQPGINNLACASIKGDIKGTTSTDSGPSNSSIRKARIQHPTYIEHRYEISTRQTLPSNPRTHQCSRPNSASYRPAGHRPSRSGICPVG